VSFLCKLVGHNYVLTAIDSEGMCEAVCTRCSDKIKLPRKFFCDQGQHEWKPAAYIHYTRKYRDGTVMGDATRRTWRCPHCGEIKQDAEDEKIDGTWFILDGEFVHETELKKRGYKVVSVKKEES
jgi:hypothetical protein